MQSALIPDNQTSDYWLQKAAIFEEASVGVSFDLAKKAINRANMAFRHAMKLDGHAGFKDNVL